MKTKERISFTIDVDIIKRLKELKETECLNISQFVNNAILKHLQEEKA